VISEDKLQIKRINNTIQGIKPSEETSLMQQLENQDFMAKKRSFLNQENYNVYRKKALRDLPNNASHRRHMTDEDCRVEHSRLVADQFLQSAETEYFKDHADAAMKLNNNNIGIDKSIRISSNV